MESNSGIGFVKEEEVEQAKKLIEENLGFKPPVMTGYNMAIKIYVRPEDFHTIKDDNGNVIMRDGKPVYIELPESIRTDEKYLSQVGLVISQGPDCYKGKRFEESGPWCRVGDFVMFPRNAGMSVKFKGVPMILTPDDSVKMILENPEDIEKF